MGNLKQPVILRFKDDTFPVQLMKLLSKRGRVKVGGIGVFEVRRISSKRIGGFGKKGKDIFVKEHNRIKFRPTKKLNDSVQIYEQ